MGQSKPFDLNELISLLDKDKFEIASVAMAKDYELVQSGDSGIYLTGSNYIGFLDIDKYALTAEFKQKDGTLSNQPVAIMYMFMNNTEFEEFNSQLKNGNWNTIEFQSKQDGMLVKLYSNGQVNVIIGIIAADTRENQPLKYLVMVGAMGEKDFDIPSLKEEASKMVYPAKTSGAGGKDGDSREAQKANQGDEDGTVGSRALYGNAGGGGSTLQMNGWMWDSTPKPKDTSSESGKLVFQVVIDNKGNIVRVKTVESDVSPTLEKVYRDEVRKLTFSKTAGTSVANTSTGTITFVIMAR